ncbi:hypothetical protein ISN45_Aa01g028860 [Arabidopsis thaliana x Arabidopsis arenosa]|uniref:Uncharacterized protein n=1 Tax=Arabidopsis thaliana x Arabidopsis arenosa TaxID=1240361 RepID=A0A8T2C778_9BRAS|nr:hypothetical protein ISN45_Aa01g028860 [Arabidopsis thaliana x Arabidopsis arenosa]
MISPREPWRLPSARLGSQCDVVPEPKYSPGSGIREGNGLGTRTADGLGCSDVERARVFKPRKGSVVKSGLDIGFGCLVGSAESRNGWQNARADRRRTRAGGEVVLSCFERVPRAGVHVCSGYFMFGSVLALPASSFKPQHFEEFFTESPPLSESGLDWAGSSEPENVAPSEVSAVPVTTSDDDRAVGDEPGTSSEQALAKDLKETLPSEVEPEMAADPIHLINITRMENENVTPVDPGSPLFLSGDGFEPGGVLFPHAVFHFPSREKKEAYDFMDKVIDKHRRLCDERQRLGLKRQTLEARIARVKRKMLRMYLRAKGQVPGPVNAPVEVAPFDSEEEDEEEDDNPCKRVRNEPGVDGKNEASSSNFKPAMKEPVPEPLP